MRLRTLAAPVLACLMLLALDAVVLGQEKTPEPEVAFKPTLVLRLKALDDLIGDLRYLAKTAGQDEIASQVEKALKQRTGEGGLEGLDTKQPIGAYAILDSKLDQSQVVVMLPIADEQKFMKLLENVDLKPEKQQDGSYKLEAPGVPVPLLFRFENKYLYGMAQFNKNASMPAKDKLPKPAAVLKGDGFLNMAVNVENLPNQVRKAALSILALQLGNIKDEAPPGATDKQKELWEATIDEVSNHLKSLIEEGRSLNVNVDVDKKKQDLSLTINVSGRKGSTLAKNIESLATAKGLGPALISPGAAMAGWVNLSLPESIRKPLAPAIDEALKIGVDKAKEQDKKAAEKASKAIAETLKAGVLDVAAELRGPNKNSKYAGVFAFRVKGGDVIEKTMKEIIADLPEAERKKIKIDADKLDNIAIHSAETKLDDKGKALFGEGPAYFAFRKDAAMLTLGEDALGELKKSLPATAKAGRLMHVEASLGKITALMTEVRGNAEETAKRVFKEKGSDKMTLSLTAGKELELKFSMKAQILAFFGDMGN